jgi:hypothetical protein
VRPPRTIIWLTPLEHLLVEAGLQVEKSRNLLLSNPLDDPIERSLGALQHENADVAAFLVHRLPELAKQFLAEILGLDELDHDVVDAKENREVDRAHFVEKMEVLGIHHDEPTLGLLVELENPTTLPGLLGEETEF